MFTANDDYIIISLNINLFFYVNAISLDVFS